MICALRGVERWIRRRSYDSALWWGERIGAVWWHGVWRRRAEAEAAGRRSLGGGDGSAARRIVRDMFRHLGMSAAESLWLSPDRIVGFVRDRIRIEGLEHAARAREAGNGGLILTAHLGNFDLLCCAAPAIGFPLTIVAKRMRNAAVDEWVRRRWGAFGVEVLPPRESMRDCIRATRAGRFLGFMLDQNMTRDEGVFVEFFGRPACTTVGLAVLAAYTGAPVLPVFIVREAGGRHCVRVLPALDPPRGRDRESLRAATQAYTRVIEEEIRKRPEQWIWLHRRWRTQPLDEDRDPV
ncbi:MAG: lysophospholipid acyltransferase family protein [Kiritimatiellae bacterium]|nr:lysophospholipid acyltransferase family protein [Kiritimatiellia bacterium]